jgi:hypothetical protein
VVRPVVTGRVRQNRALQRKDIARLRSSTVPGNGARNRRPRWVLLATAGAVVLGGLLFDRFPGFLATWAASSFTRFSCFT